MNIQPLVFLSFLLILLIGCGDKNGQTTTTTDPEAPDAPPVVDEMAQAKKSIEGILIAYYEDLAQEQMDESKYFAPVVEQFFGSQQLERAEVGNSIRNGFANISDREIYIDPKTIAVRQEGERYIVGFSGQQSFLRASDQKKVEERFSNQITFNETFQIVRYESLGAQESSSRMVPQQTAAGAAKGLAEALGRGDIQAAQAFVHPEMGFYYLTHPGAMDALTLCRSISDMTEDPLTSYMKERLLNLRCTPQEEALPSFDCDRFSKQGCFLAKPEKPYERLSLLMAALNEVELGNFSDSDIRDARKQEQAVSIQLLDTTVPVAFYFGEIDGKWYLLVVDIASYDCSA